MLLTIQHRNYKFHAISDHQANKSFDKQTNILYTNVRKKLPEFP